LLSGTVAEGGGHAESEMPYVSGGISRTLATSGTSLRDRSSRPIGSLHIIRDVTELKALQEQNKRRDRLTAMGEMAVELAHEIRNPLGSIELFASLLEKELPPGSDTARWAENIRTGSRSLNNIVSNMLHFANPVAPTLAAVDLHEVLREVLSFTAPITSQRGVGVETSLEASESCLSGDPELLKQMMLNLILNSLQAMPSHGTLSIATRDGSAAALPGNGRCLELCIRDTGVGIAPENLERVFDPFFTTSKRGTGLGLSVVHRIVERHSGVIQVASRLGEGTTFTIVLPLEWAGRSAA
jgi:signal transduction histidine kinase